MPKPLLQEKHIVHADLGKSNVIVGTDGRLTPIDFSLCGYSHFYMDIGGIFGLNHDDENRKHIIEGYKSVRNCEINPRYVEPYFSLGVVLFIACQYERAKNWDWFPGNMERWCRDIFQPLADKRSFITI
jgi:Ser/Thr protein kinase RdoA (MazF antagonist)